MVYKLRYQWNCEEIILKKTATVRKFEKMLKQTYFSALQSNPNINNSVKIKIMLISGAFCVD
jgi:hypothetical protein